MSFKKIGQFIVHAREERARLGELSTAHGSILTPAFMPVGTQGTVKGVLPRDLREIGCQILLCNTYHLHIQPGDDLVRNLGGLHKFMGWSGPILTDSGGFQVYSLADLRKVDDSGVWFRSHRDGSAIFFDPEKVVRIQENLGVDIMMVLDECVGHDATWAESLRALERTSNWATLSLAARTSRDQLMFGIIQGGMYLDLRTRSLEEITNLGFDGHAIGGLSVGESKEQMYGLTDHLTKLLPEDKPRYLMGVGMPEDILKAVSCGVDMFDCVIPTRSGRFGRLFVGSSFINIRNAVHKTDERALDPDCDCYACLNFSRGYLAHLFRAEEVLGIQLASLHNLRYYQRLMVSIRQAIREHRFLDFYEGFLRGDCQVYGGEKKENENEICQVV